MPVTKTYCFNWKNRVDLHTSLTPPPMKEPVTPEAAKVFEDSTQVQRPVESAFDSECWRKDCFSDCTRRTVAEYRRRYGPESSFNIYLYREKNWPHFSFSIGRSFNNVKRRNYFSIVFQIPRNRNYRNWEPTELNLVLYTSRKKFLEERKKWNLRFQFDERSSPGDFRQTQRIYLFGTTRILLWAST